MIILAAITGRLYFYSAAQLDSIASRVYDKLEITVFSKEKVWKLKPCISATKAD